MPDGEDRDLWSRLSAVETKVQTLVEEVRRNRDRIHKVEKNEKAVSLLTQHVGTVTETVSALAQTVKDLAASIETTAAHAAEHAIERFHAERDEKARVSWRDRLSFGMLVVAVGGIVIQLLR